MKVKTLFCPNRQPKCSLAHLVCSTCLQTKTNKKTKTKYSPDHACPFFSFFSFSPKLAIVCKTFNQFIIAFQTHRGPKPDVDELKSLLAQTRRLVGIKVLVADAGYDSEPNHEFVRQVIGARTVIPAKHGSPTDKPARGKYRRLMQTRFDQHTYRHRAQVETTVSMIKRRQGNHILGKTYWSQTRELRLMVLTHNIMILWCGILFYRAGPVPVSPGAESEQKIGTKRRFRRFLNFGLLGHR
ncbi:MAG: transposase [Pirellulaceae bacterium]|nr:transposase [Pirellulaceae bacterium]